MLAIAALRDHVTALFPRASQEPLPTLLSFFHCP